MIKVVFFVTLYIAIKSLDLLQNSSEFDVQAIVCQPDRPSGRGHKILPPPVKSYAIEHKSEVLHPKSIRKEPDIINRLKELAPDFFVTFARSEEHTSEL